MTRKLDFIVFGLPRGGTTAVANYLSAVPQVHCGVEVFPTFLDHAALDIPSAFVERQDALWNDSSAEEIRTRGDEIKVFGNKTPTYFYRLPTLMEELDNCPTIACVRDLREVATSYSKRAGDPGDPWVEGRVGLFAMGDALIMLHALHNTGPEANIMILPQGALLEDWRAVMTRALAHVAPGIPAEFDEKRLTRIDRIKRKTMAREKPVLEPAEKRALNRLRQDGVFDFFARKDIVMLSEVRDEVAALLERIPPNPIAFVRRHAENHTNPKVMEHFDRWARHARKSARAYGFKGGVGRKAKAE